MRIYLDTCALQRPLDDPAQLRVRLEAEAVVAVLSLCEAGMLTLVTSAAHGVETDRNPHPARAAHARRVLALGRAFASVTDRAAARAATYEQEGLHRLDALHLALAVEGGAVFFCTTDDRLRRRAETLETGETTVVSPLDLIQRLP